MTSFLCEWKVGPQGGGSYVWTEKNQIWRNSDNYSLKNGGNGPSLGSEKKTIPNHTYKTFTSICTWVSMAGQKCWETFSVQMAKLGVKKEKIEQFLV